MTKLFEMVKLTPENIAPGLVLRSPASDGSVHIFNDTTIEKIEGDKVFLARPYCIIKDGVLEVGCERFWAPKSTIFNAGRYHFVMEGTKPANTIL